VSCILSASLKNIYQGLAYKIVEFPQLLTIAFIYSRKLKEKMEADMDRWGVSHSSNTTGAHNISLLRA
jgi:hypothetical protein